LRGKKVVSKHKLIKWTYNYAKKNGTNPPDVYMDLHDFLEHCPYIDTFAHMMSPEDPKDYLLNIIQLNGYIFVGISHHSSMMSVCVHETKTICGRKLSVHRKNNTIVLRTIPQSIRYFYTIMAEAISENVYLLPPVLMLLFLLMSPFIGAILYYLIQ
jgi:hypothetical protein